MKNIMEIINSLPELSFLGSVNMIEIEKGEKKLGISFASDFKRYTEKFGAISADGIELFGVVSNERLSVVENTIQCRKKFPDFPKDMYIIEDLSIDMIFILQNHKGEIYEYVPEVGIKLIYSSLLEYLMEK